MSTPAWGCSLGQGQARTSSGWDLNDPGNIGNLNETWVDHQTLLGVGIV